MALLLILAGCQSMNQTNNSVAEATKIKIAATVYPIYDIARNVGGDLVEVNCIIEPGSSPHTFEFSPADIKKLQGTNVIFSVNPKLDGWVDEIISSVDGAQKIEVSEGIELMQFGAHADEEHVDDEHEEEHEDEHEHEEDEHEHDHSGVDPHYWLNTENAKIITTNIADELIKIDPDNESTYKDNLNSYLNELDSLHDELSNKLNELNSRDMIVFHDSWNYFAKEFNLNIVGVFQISPGKEPTPKFLENLYKTAEDLKIKAVFSEPQLSSGVIEPFINDLGLNLYVLDPLGGIGERDSYLGMMRYNADTIYQAMNE